MINTITNPPVTFVVYKITNLLNGNYYHGKTTLARWENGYMGSGKLISLAIKKHGKENFAREIISTHTCEKEAYDAEIAVINYKDNKSYNMASGGKGCGSGDSNPIYGRITNEETKAKLRLALSGEKNPFYGKKHPPHIIERLRLASTGRTYSPEVNAKKGRKGKEHPRYGKLHNEESRHEMSVNRKGKYTGDQNHFYGKQHSAVSIQKMKDTKRGTRWYYSLYTGKARTFVRDAIIPAGYILGRSTKHFDGLFNPQLKARQA